MRKLPISGQISYSSEDGIAELRAKINECGLILSMIEGLLVEPMLSLGIGLISR